jgi:hypothetical protein
MAKTVDYLVAREHQGDRLTEDGSEVHRFMEGEIRKADPAIVANLVKSGVLVAPNETEEEDEPVEEKSDAAPANKSEPAPANKAQGKAPANKSKPKD